MTCDLVCETCDQPMCIGPCEHEAAIGLSHHLDSVGKRLDTNHVARAKPIKWKIQFADGVWDEIKRRLENPESRDGYKCD